MAKEKQRKISLDGGSGLGSSPFAAMDGQAFPPVAEVRRQVSAAPPRQAQPKVRERIEVRREKAGRGGKTVTTLRGFPSHMSMDHLDALALALKKACACGGTRKDRALELQGDVRTQVGAELERRGFRPVAAGG